MVKSEKKTVLKNPKVLDKEIFKYDSENPFVKGHLQELNRCYNAKAYTACFMLARKISEGLLIDLLKEMFPPNSRENKEKYWNFNGQRYKDFKDLLKEFGDNIHLLEEKQPAGRRLLTKLTQFKGDANLKTHYLVHLVRKKKEIDEFEIQHVFDLFSTLWIK